MKKFYIKLGLVLLVHIMSFCFFAMASLNADLSDDTVVAWSLFVVEPICTLVVYPLINWIIIYIILKVQPIRQKNKTLIIVAVVSTIFLLCVYVYNYSIFWLEDGFSFFVYKDYWKNVLF